MWVMRRGNYLDPGCCRLQLSTLASPLGCLTSHIISACTSLHTHTHSPLTELWPYNGLTSALRWPYSPLTELWPYTDILAHVIAALT